MEWNTAEIRNLRLRLGWSQAEFARRLGCRPEHVRMMENGHIRPDYECGQVMSALHQHVEAYHWQVRCRPLSELKMQHEGVTQVDISNLSLEQEANGAG